MRRFAFTLLFAAGLVVLARLSPVVPNTAQACTEDGGDGDDDGDNGEG